MYLDIFEYYITTIIIKRCSLRLNTINHDNPYIWVFQAKLR